MKRPLVSVICLCYNQGNFVRDALESVINQTYEPLELIIVDDASSDHSENEIRDFLKLYPEIRFIQNDRNVGNCASFNKGFHISTGDYVIDLAADDILMRNRIEEGIKAFNECSDDYGVNFSDVLLIDESSGKEKTLYKRDEEGNLLEKIPQGNVYRDLIQKYFICPPSMMIKRRVLDKLDGYDESLSYEDFDFWIRSSRYFNYCFTDKILVKKRILNDSLSAQQFKSGNKHQLSTLKVCKKIYELNRGKDEKDALGKRLKYEIRQSLRMKNYQAAEGFLKLLKDNHNIYSHFIYNLAFHLIHVFR